MSDRQIVAVSIRGKEFRVRSDEDPARLARIATFVDETMTKVESRTGAVDTIDVAMLTALNLARELIELRDAGGNDPARMETLIELAESAIAAEPN